jgi:hypothetical protein
MKNLINYITESKIENDLAKCKNLEQLICRFQGVKSLSELTQDDMDAFDLGFIWFNDENSDMKLNDFIKKVKSYGDAKIEDLNFDKSHGIMTFSCNGDDFDLDYVDNY